MCTVQKRIDRVSYERKRPGSLSNFQKLLQFYSQIKAFTLYQHDGCQRLLLISKPSLIIPFQMPGSIEIYTFKYISAHMTEWIIERDCQTDYYNSLKLVIWNIRTTPDNVTPNTNPSSEVGTANTKYKGCKGWPTPLESIYFASHPFDFDIPITKLFVAWEGQKNSNRYDGRYLYHDFGASSLLLLPVLLVWYLLR